MIRQVLGSGTEFWNLTPTATYTPSLLQVTVCKKADRSLNPWTDILPRQPSFILNVSRVESMVCLALDEDQKERYA